MIVCFCHGINDRALEKIIDNGATTVRDIGDACGAGTDCGSCANRLRRTLKRRQAVVQETERAPLSK